MHVKSQRLMHQEVKSQVFPSFFFISTGYRRMRESELAASACCLAHFGHFSLTFLPTVTSRQVSPSLDTTACLAEIACCSTTREDEERVDSFAAEVLHMGELTTQSQVVPVVV